jgi:hypothetical protein
MTGEEKRSAPGEERGTCNCETGGWYWRFARGVSGCVGCVVVGSAKKCDRVPRGCVGCVTYVPGRSSSPGEGARGGEEETIGSSRYMVW